MFVAGDKIFGEWPSVLSSTERARQNMKCGASAAHSLMCDVFIEECKLLPDKVLLKFAPFFLSRFHLQNINCTVPPVHLY